MRERASQKMIWKSHVCESHVAVSKTSARVAKASALHGYKPAAVSEYCSPTPKQFVQTKNQENMCIISHCICFVYDSELQLLPCLGVSFSVPSFLGFWSTWLFLTLAKAYCLGTLKRLWLFLVGCPATWPDPRQVLPNLRSWGFSGLANGKGSLFDSQDCLCPMKAAPVPSSWLLRTGAVMQISIHGLMQINMHGLTLKCAFWCSCGCF